MVEIIPAIIPESFSDLDEKLSLVYGYTDFIQIDVLDGVLTPHASWPFIVPKDEDFARIIREEEGLPFWEDTRFEIDLMVKKERIAIDEWIAAGAERLIVHFESFSNAEEAQKVFDDFKSRFSIPGSILSAQIGLAVDLDTELDKFLQLLPLCDFFQCMGVSKIGFQGNPFDDRAITRVKEVKGKFPDLTVSVDGGVTLDTGRLLVKAGVDRLVVGSTIFRSEDIPGTIEELKSLQ
jgi:ribulose-phosphate 3-epimerase